MPRHQLPDPADPNSNNNGVRNRKASADEIQGLHRQTVEARRRLDRQLVGQRLATEGRSGDSSDRASAATQRPDGTSSSDNEASDCLIQDEANNPVWPNVDPKQRMINARQREEEARRRYQMGISKDREQYKKLLISAGIMENKKTKHLGHKNWTSDEENLAEVINAEVSDMDSFI